VYAGWNLLKDPLISFCGDVQSWKIEEGSGTILSAAARGKNGVN